MDKTLLKKALDIAENKLSKIGLSTGPYAEYAESVVEEYLKLTNPPGLSEQVLSIDEKEWENVLKLLEADKSNKPTFVLGRDDHDDDDEPQLYRQSSYQLARTLFHNPHCNAVVFEHDYQKFYVVNAEIDETKGDYKILRFKLADQSILAVLDSIKYSTNPDNTKEVIEFIKTKHVDPGPCPDCNDHGEIETEHGPQGCNPCNSRLIPFMNTKGQRDFIDWGETLELRGDGLHLIKPETNKPEFVKLDPSLEDRFMNRCRNSQNRR